MEKYNRLTRISLFIIGLFLFTDGIISIALLTLKTLEYSAVNTQLRCNCTGVCANGTEEGILTANRVPVSQCRPFWKRGPLKHVFVCNVDDEKDPIGNLKRDLLLLKISTQLRMKKGIDREQLISILDSFLNGSTHVLTEEEFNDIFEDDDSQTEG